MSRQGKLAIPNLHLSLGEWRGFYTVTRHFAFLEIVMRKLLIMSAAALLAATGAIAAAPTHFVGANLMPMAKVSLAQARKTALAAHPGTITDQELEKEGGGTGLRYSFDIKAKGKTFEVGVDGRTGKVLENKAEGPHPD
jgi:hypothetical protein